LAVKECGGGGSGRRERRVRGMDKMGDGVRTVSVSAHKASSARPQTLWRPKNFEARLVPETEKDVDRPKNFAFRAQLNGA
jgi:hypothetical protein